VQNQESGGGVTAELAQKTDRCGSCGKPCGEIRYRLKSGLVRCKDCAAQIGPVPELVLANVTPRVHPQMPKFTAFGARRAWKAVREDWKQKQAGG
jgi:recombinational DNA repair protein (RecF pathway)